MSGANLGEERRARPRELALLNELKNTTARAGLVASSVRMQRERPTSIVPATALAIFSVSAP